MLNKINANFKKYPDENIKCYEGNLDGMECSSFVSVPIAVPHCVMKFKPAALSTSDHLSVGAALSSFVKPP